MLEFDPARFSAAACTRVAQQLLNAALTEDLLGAVAAPATGPGPCTHYFMVGDTAVSVRARRGLFGRLWVEARGLWLVHERREWPWSWALVERVVRHLPGTAAAREALLTQLAATCHWSTVAQAQRPTASRRELCGGALESALHEGHPYHPCFRARIGFDAADHAAYSPEAGAAFALNWLLVPRAALQARGEAGRAPWSGQLLPAQTRAELLSAAACRGLAPEAYAPLPVHPWQWQRVLAAQWPALAAAGAVQLGVLGATYTATQSVRTLAPVGEGAHLKLSLGITNTSAPRHLQRYGLQAGVLISDWLIEVLAADSFFQRHPLRLLPEFASAAISPEWLPDQAGATALGALWRAAPPADSLPLNALTCWEADGRPFIDAWVQRFGLERWLRRLLEVLVVPCWGLLSRAGIAVEAHAQNTLLVCRDGWPESICLRDTHESLEYLPGLLPAGVAPPAFDTLAEFDPPPGAGGCYWMPAAEDLFELFSDTVLTYQLADLARLLQLAYGYPERAFAQALAATFATCADACPAARWPLAALRWRAEPLLAAKLGCASTFTVPNELAPLLAGAASSDLRSGVAVHV